MSTEQYQLVWAWDRVYPPSQRKVRRRKSHGVLVRRLVIVLASEVPLAVGSLEVCEAKLQEMGGGPAYSLPEGDREVALVVVPDEPDTT